MVLKINTIYISEVPTGRMRPDPGNPYTQEDIPAYEVYYETPILGRQIEREFNTAGALINWLKQKPANNIRVNGQFTEHSKNILERIITEHRPGTSVEMESRPSSAKSINPHTVFRIKF